MHHEIPTQSAESVKDIHHVAYLQQDWTTVAVRFHDFRSAKDGESDWKYGNFTNGRSYVYRVRTSWNLQPGDLLLVPVGHNEELKVVCVMEIHDIPEMDFTSDYVVRWAVSKVQGISEYEEQAKKEKEAVQLLRQAERFARHREVLKTLEEGCGGVAIEKARALFLPTQQADPKE